MHPLTFIYVFCVRATARAIWKEKGEVTIEDWFLDLECPDMLSILKLL
jgi:hypothetical protein